MVTAVLQASRGMAQQRVLHPQPPATSDQPLRPQAQHEALLAGRQREQTEEFVELYAVRAGVAGTIAQAVRSGGLRRSRYIGQARTHLKAADLAHAQATHDALVARLSAMTRPLGAVGHQPHLSPQNPDKFLAIDTWNNLEGLRPFISNPAVAAELGGLFAGPPGVSVWAEAGWAAFRG